MAKIQGKQIADSLRDEANPFSSIHVDQLIGSSLSFKGKNAELNAMSIGQAVYVSGVSGDVPEVKLADSDGSGTMPAVGLTASAANSGADVYIISSGNLGGLNTAALGTGIVGRAVYVDTTAGGLTVDAPSGSSAKLQNIGQVIREHSSEGIIKVGGAGRSAATPNLDTGKIFIGDGNNQSSISAYTLPTADGSSGQVLTTDGSGAVTFQDAAGGASTPTLISSTSAQGLTADTEYVIDPAITGTPTLSVPITGVTDGAQIKITNLSDYAVNIRRYDTSGAAKLYYADGTSAPSIAFYTTGITIESRGTIRLYQSGSGDPAKWYTYFSPSYEVETAYSSLAAGSGLAYSTASKSFVNAGEIHGTKILSANIDNTVYPWHVYATAYNETTARSISLPDREANPSLCNQLDGQRIFFENRGTSTLTIDLFDRSGGSAPTYYKAYLRNWSGGIISGHEYVLQAGERVVIEVEQDTTTTTYDTYYNIHYRLGKYRPDYDTTTDTSGTSSTISHGREQHLTYVVDTSNNVTITLPAAANCKPDWRVTVKSIGTGTTTVSRAGTDTIDGQTSTDLTQYQQITLARISSTAWAIINEAASGGGASYTYSAVSAATVTGAAWYHYSVDTSSNAVTITLPALSGLTDGDEIRVKVRDATNTVTIDANSTETIDGNETLVLNTQYEAVTLVAGSTEWEII